MRKYGIFLLSLILLLPLILSCRAEPLAPEEPILTLLSPGNGEKLPAGPVVVKIYVQNFTLIENTGQSNQAGQGHVIYYLDIAAPIVPGESATTSSDSFASSQNSYTWQNLTPGDHIFSVELVNNDNTPLLPPVAVRVNVIVTGK
jgi:hypothetical protein